MAPKTVIVTGASRGIGLAVAEYLLKAPQSSNVVIIARSQSPLERLKDQYPSQVQLLAGDLWNFSLAEEAVKLARNKWGQLDGLVLNHGVLEPVRKLADVEIEDWKKAFDTNFFSAIAFVKAALPALRSSKGRVILTSSGAAVTGYSGWGPYGSSKAALNHLALTLAAEEPDVTTIALRPGVVDTQMQKSIRELHHESMDKKDAEKFASLKEKGGLLRPEQPGNVIARLVAAAPSELSGNFLSWNDSSLAAFQD
ncbi:MAG: hypothetical protein M1835_007883 [Candelina submexicana]|nr:MAG: hypothetical protein M1835_007883 [Candelina submexicana]